MMANIIYRKVGEMATADITCDTPEEFKIALEWMEKLGKLSQISTKKEYKNAKNK